MHKKTILMGLVLILGVSSLSVSATSRYLNADGTPNYNKLTSQANNNQLNAEMRNALLQGLGGHNTKLITALNAIKTELGVIKGLITPSAPAVINGQCGSSGTLCASGELEWIDKTPACGQQRTRSCRGSNGGSTMGCTTANPPCKIEVTLQDDVALELGIHKRYSSIPRSQMTCPDGYRETYRWGDERDNRNKGVICKQILSSNRKAYVGAPCLTVASVRYERIEDSSDLFYDKGKVSANGECIDTSQKKIAHIRNNEYFIGSTYRGQNTTVRAAYQYRE